MPTSFLGTCKKTLSTYKAAWMALRMVISPPKPKPKIILLDTNTIALAILGIFTKYNVFYVEHFASLKNIEEFTSYIKFTPSLFSAWWIKYADEIIVQSDCISNIFRRSYPNVKKELKVFPPLVDIGIWAQECIDIRRIIPDLPEECMLFSVFGKYWKRSNFRLAIGAFEQLLVLLEDSTKSKVHLVFAGQTKTIDQKVYYNEIIEVIKEKPFANQITVLRQLPVVHKKTIISNSIAVLHTAKYEVHPGPIIAAMHLGTPVIATNTGIAASLMAHRITGILVEPLPQKFAAAMYKIVLKPTLREFIKEMAKDKFGAHYSFECFSRKVNELFLKYETSSDDKLKSS